MAETTITIESTLSALVEQKKYTTLRDILVTMNPSDVAAVFEEMDESACPCCSGCCPRSWRRTPSWRWSRRHRSC